MRSGACTVQQTLTAEAASVLKHSLGLARRRGHGQVTPLHVAATLLSSRTSLLRSACLKSRSHHHHQASSHPLQCRALELCFNVALNRLPTTPGPILHGQPSLSNAFVAALKRAQAHQRSGCIEQQQQQQQPTLTIKVELEQLIISILDDPSVSRVMREAGFSSTAVKNNIEDSSHSPVFHCYSTSPTDTRREIINPSTFWQTPFFFPPQKKLSSNYVADSTSLKEDIKLVFEVFLRKRRRNSVIVGDCVSVTESLVSELTCRIERGDVPEEINHVHFVKFYFSPMSLRFMKRDDVENHVNDLKRRVDSISCGGSGGAIIYTGDLKWTVEENLNGEITGYSAVDHIVTEIGRLVSDYNSSNTKVWLLATASYQTYLRCQMRQPPLEAQWALQAVSVPSGGLNLSLHASSSNYEKDVQSFKSGQQKLLPPWLQSNNGSQKDEMVELRRKYKTVCHSLHRERQNQSHLRYPWWPSESSSFSDLTSISFTDSDSKPNHRPNSVPRFRRQNSCTFELNFGNATNKHQSSEQNLDSLKNGEVDKEVNVSLALGTCIGKPVKETSSRLRDLLQGNLPWQSEIIPSIVEALTDSKTETWLLIEGDDVIGKRRLARAVAEYVLGSPDLVLHMDMKNNEVTTSWNQRLVSSFSSNEKLVVMVENVDLADTRFLKLLADRFESERDSNRAIYILTKSISSSYGDGNTNHDSVIQMKLNVNERSTPKNTDNKRKLEWGESNKTKTQRTRPSFHILDLNMTADETDNSCGEFSPMSSNITAEPNVQNEFLECIKNYYTFNKTEDQYKEIKELFMAKMKGVVEETLGGKKGIRFSVEDRVLEGVLFGSSYFVNSLFDKWLKDIFQTRLQTVKNGAGEGGIVAIRLSYGSILEKSMGNGYMGTCLPGKIQVCFGV
ncbi:protein SMAX1-LIKE 5-like [Hibiscus syriacus]|uniref:protein SMAX1-LIKE 5-like n=1 Tax=Hibiscus syriacus TaxID=106335 RepID=UPI001923E8BF|nr:protein SMAX1-LIKE 5-like [Hibiscus syriacus]